MSDDKNVKNQNDNDQGESHTGLTLGMCFGVALGLSIGQFLFHSATIGMCFGLGVGMCFGAAYDAAQNNKKSSDGKTDKKPADPPVSEDNKQEENPESGEE